MTTAPMHGFSDNIAVAARTPPSADLAGCCACRSKRAFKEAYQGKLQILGLCTLLLSVELRLIAAHSHKVPQLLLDLARQALLQLSLCSFCLHQNCPYSILFSIMHHYRICSLVSTQQRSIHTMAMLTVQQVVKVTSHGEHGITSTAHDQVHSNPGLLHKRGQLMVHL